MIFTGIKRKSNQIFFNKEARNFSNNFEEISSENINKIIIFLDDSSKKSDIVSNLQALFNLSKEDIEILVFNKKSNENNTEERFFTPKCFGWYGKINSNTLKSILTKKYDLLINYSKIESLYNNLLILQCKSSFNIGYAELDKSFYDLLIDCNPSDFKTFNNEIEKYLKILNKV